MGGLVVHYHPVDDSFSGALLDATLAGFTDAGIDVRLIKLTGDDAGSPSRRQLVDADLGEVDRLVFVYPTWWGGLPARLLQFVTDLLGDVVDGDRQESPLRDISDLRIVTSHGSTRFINRLQGEPGLMMWRETVVPLCAPGCSFQWQALYGLDRLDESGRLRFVDEVRGTTMASISSPSV